MVVAATKPTHFQPCEQYWWQQVPLNGLTGSEVFERLFLPDVTAKGTMAELSPRNIATLLESPYPLPPESLPVQAAGMARYSICAGPPRQASGCPQLWTPAVGQILPFIERLEQQLPPGIILEATDFQQNTPAELPFTGGWLGWLGYDLAWEIEQLPNVNADTLPFPVAFWYEPAAFAVADHNAQMLWLAAESSIALQQLAGRLSGDLEERQSHLEDMTVQGQTFGFSLESDRATFEQAVRRAKAHIRAGDVFQVNHSLRFRAKTTLDSWSVYRALQQINPSPFASYWHTPWGSVVSCSPERLLHLSEGVAQSRPIAGTRPRGQSPTQDHAYAQTLKVDRKEQAEHIMLVDLERNDLGRVCEWGSVQVAELMTIERYSHVMHLVSNVVGQLRSDAGISALIAALFPGGTITGCPKVRCMEIIEALEPVRRSLFYGSCGYIDRRGRADLNILIRTLLMVPDSVADDPSELLDSPPVQTVWGQVGAGIVADSIPEREWRESLQKAKAQLLALGFSGRFVEKGA